MKLSLVKSLIFIAFLAFGAPDASAQGFLKKLEKATKKLDKATQKLDKVAGAVTGTTGTSTTGTASATDSISPKDMVANAPLFTTKRVITLDEKGDTVKNEDGTVKYQYLLFDKNGKLCDRNTARKELNAALKSFGIVLAKVGGGAGLGALAKGGWKSIAAGAAGGALASAGDIMAMTKHFKRMKACRKELKAYEKTFTEEGTPIDASIDLSDVDGINFEKCEETSMAAAEVKQELMNSKEAGESLEDIDFDNLKV